MHEIRLTREDNGKTIEAPLDATLLLSLPENPATGYTWAVDMQDRDAMQMLESTYQPGGDLTPGRGGQRVFRFGILQAGTVQLRLKHWRAWEGDKSIVERFEVTVHAVR